MILFIIAFLISALHRLVPGSVPTYNLMAQAAELDHSYSEAPDVSITKNKPGCYSVQLEIFSIYRKKLRDICEIFRRVFFERF